MLKAAALLLAAALPGVARAGFPFAGEYSDPNHPGCARSIAVDAAAGRGEVSGADAAGGEGEARTQTDAQTYTSY